MDNSRKSNKSIRRYPTNSSLQNKYKQCLNTGKIILIEFQLID